MRRHVSRGVLVLVMSMAWVWVALGQNGAGTDWAPILPTDNRALFSGDNPAFYQYTDRRIRPGFDLPWMGGRYGFVRNGVQTRWGVLYPRFHEGIDIKPLRRTSRGEPLDEVRSIADGTVMHISRTSGYSSYGRYLVVEHWWHGSPYYSLYAHMNTISVEVGQEVAKGERVGIMGYTGRGLNRRRAHLHLEVNLLLNRYFQRCYEEYFPGQANRHGAFNGLNLAGVDVAEMYLQLEKDPTLTLERLVQETPGFISVTVPSEGMLDILWLYPWLSPQLKGWEPDFGALPELARSWRITLSRSGLPVRIEALEIQVDGYSLEVLEETPIPYRYLTRLISGSGESATLTSTGQRVVDFILCTPSEELELLW